MAQGIKVTNNILYQDNKSAILLEKNGRASSSKRTNPIEVRYYYVADWIEKGDLSVVWCPTDKMIADILTKPLQDKVFQKFRDVLTVAFLCNMTLCKSVCQDVLNVNRFVVLIGYKVGCRSVLAGRSR